MPKNIEISIVVPCYNEEKNIPLVLERFSKFIASNMELVIVNNGSSDGTERLLKNLIPRYKFVKVVKIKQNKGYGYGILTGLGAAKGNYLCWTHADLQTDPKDTLMAYSIIKDKPKTEKFFIKGIRQGRLLGDRFFTFCMSLFCSVMLGEWLDDINAQPNFFHRSFLKYMKSPPHDFSLDLYALYIAKKNHFTIVRFPVFFKKRLHGESHWNTNIKTRIKFIKRTISFTLKLKKLLKNDYNNP